MLLGVKEAPPSPARVRPHPSGQRGTVSQPSAGSGQRHRAASWSTTDTSSPPSVAPATAALGRVNARLPLNVLCPASGHRPPPPCPTQPARPCVGLPWPSFAGSVTGQTRLATSPLSVHQVYGHGPPASLRVQRSGATHSRSCHPNRRRSASDWPASMLAKWTQRGTVALPGTANLRRLRFALRAAPQSRFVVHPPPQAHHRT